MGRNKGRQCGGYTSKMERFTLQRLWQRQVSKVVTQRRQERVRVDVVKALMNARLKDDQVEQIKLKRIEAITTELQRSTTIQSFATLQDRCLHEIAKTFDLYSSTCPYTREFFGSFEPWMITRLSELTTAFKTMNDDNVLLLLQQTIDDLTIGFIRQEQSLALLVEDTEGKQQLTWQRSGNIFLGGHHEVESWDELDVEEVDLVQTQDDIHLRSLKLVSCRGLSVDFLARLTQIHPYIEHLEITDCFDAVDGEEGTAIMRQLVQWRSLKTLRLSWCSWLTTECLVAFAYQLLEPPASGLEELHVSHYFDVVEDYVRSIYEDLLPNLQVTL
ncbi:hypothetical protein Poli38472_004022 [Pythium oligandrum]|uniref:Uncharacterized protein n=1 Tax=Pythium oligandrum TaxID=41045 RepID=A0A8K1FNV4_PYTOL|nr:hypothetical protein Poli38472_004022 [Pythium oligandrum]|eukprot:TMW66257.1 hypothetical protein Poli38472_004022 [Pythium oligandrum]